MTGDARRFPIQALHPRSDEPRSVAWTDAEIAHKAYARLFNNGQTLDQLADRGGFGWREYLALRDVGAWMDTHPHASTDELYRLFYGVVSE